MSGTTGGWGCEDEGVDEDWVEGEEEYEEEDMEGVEGDDGLHRGVLVSEIGWCAVPYGACLNPSPVRTRTEVSIFGRCVLEMGGKRQVSNEAEE